MSSASEAARAMRLVNSEKQKQAARENGKKGGRPRKAVPISARELMALPRPQRNAILRSQAEIAAVEYRNNPELLDITHDLAGDDIIE